MHAWHGVLIQKAEANLPDICAQARKIVGAIDFEMGKGNKLVDHEVRTRVGLDSESDSEGNDEDNGDANDGDDEHQGNNDDSADDWNGHQNGRKWSGMN